MTPTPARTPPRRPAKIVRRRTCILPVPLPVTPKPKLLVTNMSRQTAAHPCLRARTSRPPVRDGILHRDIKGLVAIRLRVM